MKTGRKPHIDPPSVFPVSIPSSLARRLEEALFDPLTGKARYGARSALIEQLLERWLDERAPRAPTAPSSLDGTDPFDEATLY